ncbi:MAG TPA: hypothetical protein VFY14_08015 [Streptomyces sp.]|nr:hypothetical protein [Streptomyces sp.]
MTERPTPIAALTPAQRREILASDPVTGELGANAAVCGALVARGLAVAHGRTGAYYLNEAGLAVRERLRGSTASEPVPGEPGPGEPPEAPARRREPAAFAAATGDETAAKAAGTTEADHRARAAAVARAWAGVLEIRRVTGDHGGDATRVPAPWERARMIWAVALALEAAGVPPSAVDEAGRRVRTGYRVTASDEPGTVRVEWHGPLAAEARQEAAHRLGACVERLAERGWEALPYRGARGTRFLLVSPRTH